jgi:putative membrane protein
MTTVSAVTVGRVLTSWDSSSGTVVACVVLLVLALVYVRAAALRSPRGRRWPKRRTAAFVSGIVLLAYVFGSGLEVYEDDRAVHVVQHMLVMMAVPPLLALGAPLTLLLRTLSAGGRRVVARELRDDPALRLLSRRWAGVALTLDYYLTMYLYQLTPVRTFAEQHSLAHAGVHGYMLVCGLSLWWPLAGVDPVRLRPTYRVKQLIVALGMPAFAPLGGIELAKGDAATGWAYIVSGVILTAAGLGLLLGRESRLLT